MAFDFVQAAAGSGVSFEDRVAEDDGIVPSSVQARGGSHRSIVEQTEQLASDEAKNFTVNCACCMKGSDEAFCFHKLSSLSMSLSPVGILRM